MKRTRIKELLLLVCCCICLVIAGGTSGVNAATYHAKATGFNTAVDNKLRLVLDNTSVYSMGFAYLENGASYTGSVTLNGIELTQVKSELKDIGGIWIGGSSGSSCFFIGFLADENNTAIDLSKIVDEVYLVPTVTITAGTVFTINENSVTWLETQTFYYAGGNTWQFDKPEDKDEVDYKVKITGFNTGVDVKLRMITDYVGTMAVTNTYDAWSYTGSACLNGVELSEVVDTFDEISYIWIGYSQNGGNTLFIGFQNESKVDIEVPVSEGYSVPCFTIEKGTKFSVNGITTEFDESYKIYYYGTREWSLREPVVSGSDYQVKITGFNTEVDVKLRMILNYTGDMSAMSSSTEWSYEGSLQLNGVELNQAIDIFDNITAIQMGYSPTGGNTFFIGFKDENGNDVEPVAEDGYSVPKLSIAKGTIVTVNGKKIEFMEDYTIFYFGEREWTNTKAVVSPNGYFNPDVDAKLRMGFENLPADFGMGYLSTVDGKNIDIQYEGTILFNGKAVESYIEDEAVDYIWLGRSTNGEPHLFFGFMSLDNSFSKVDGNNVNWNYFDRVSDFRYATLFIAKGTTITNTKTNRSILFDRDLYIYYLGRNDESPFYNYKIDNQAPVIEVNGTSYTQNATVHFEKGITVEEIENAILIHDELANHINSSVTWSQEVNGELAAGTYSMIIMAEDESGNKTEIELQVVVQENQTQDPNCAGCSKGASVGLIGLLVLLAVTGILKK